ncbi:MAG: helix-turn-helix transcriptional regulator [Chloroflexi bacterium]|nr:helix-turn-helix transcriptional regulator [Chloroflexota bacterium]
MNDNPRRASALEPEYVVLGLLSQQPSHGYALHHRLQAEFRTLWSIPQNQLYSILKRLEVKGNIIAEKDRSIVGPRRRRYRVTRRGRARLRRWLERPSPMSVRALRVAFLTRLFLALAEDQATAVRILEVQRQALRNGLARFKQDAADFAEASSQERLSLDLRIRQLETAMAWMENVQSELGL